jgi:hypothetical protein
VNASQKLSTSNDQKIASEEFVEAMHSGRKKARSLIRSEIASMLQDSNLLCTPCEGDLLIGAARSLTDFSYCCYLSDWAVDLAYRGRGIGIELIRLTQSRIHPEAKLVRLATPKAVHDYPKIGMTRHEPAWTAPGAPPTGSNRSRTTLTRLSALRDRSALKLITPVNHVTAHKGHQSLNER